MGGHKNTENARDLARFIFETIVTVQTLSVGDKWGGGLSKTGVDYCLAFFLAVVLLLAPVKTSSGGRCDLV